jgi:hypothetical protein
MNLVSKFDSNNKFDLNFELVIIDSMLSYVDFQAFCKRYCLDTYSYESHFYFMCNHGLDEDIKKFIDYKIINTTQDKKRIFTFALRFALSAKKKNISIYLLENGADIADSPYSITKITKLGNVQLIIKSLYSIKDLYYISY